MTLSEVAAVTDLSPAVARRCLNTLVDLGYVGRKGKLFLLTPEVMGFASAFLESMNLEQVVRPHLQEVRVPVGDGVIRHHEARREQRRCNQRKSVAWLFLLVWMPF